MPETIARPAEADALRADAPAGPSPAPTPAPTVADVIAQALRTFDIAQIAAVSGTAGSLGVQRIELGEATIDRLVIQGI